MSIDPNLLISKWRSQNLDSELNHPALNTAHLTLSERVWAFGERYNLTWKVVSLAAIAVLGGFGLWYAGFKLAGGCVFVVTGLGAAFRKHKLLNCEYQDVIALYEAKKYYLLKGYLTSLSSVKPDTVTQTALYHNYYPLALALLFRCHFKSTHQTFNRPDVSSSGTSIDTSVLMHLVYHYDTYHTSSVYKSVQEKIPRIKTVIQIAMVAGVNSETNVPNPRSPGFERMANDPTAKALPALSPLAYVQHHQAERPHLRDLLPILQSQPSR